MIQLVIFDMSLQSIDDFKYINIKDIVKGLVYKPLDLEIVNNSSIGKGPLFILLFWFIYLIFGR